MIEKIQIVGANPKKIQVNDEPKPHIDPTILTSALNAMQAGPHFSGNPDLIDLAELSREWQ